MSTSPSSNGAPPNNISSEQGQGVGVSSAASETCCAKCAKVVYHMEAIHAEKQLYHKACFKCVTCKKALAAGSFISNKGQFYCLSHKPAAGHQHGRTDSSTSIEITSPTGINAGGGGLTSSLLSPLSPGGTTTGMSGQIPSPLSGHSKAKNESQHALEAQMDAVPDVNAKIDEEYFNTRIRNLSVSKQTANGGGGGKSMSMSEPILSDVAEHESFLPEFRDFSENNKDKEEEGNGKDSDNKLSNDEEQLLTPVNQDHLVALPYAAPVSPMPDEFSVQAPFYSSSAASKNGGGNSLIAKLPSHQDLAEIAVGGTSSTASPKAERPPKIFIKNTNNISFDEQKPKDNLSTVKSSNTEQNSSKTTAVHAAVPVLLHQLSGSDIEFWEGQGAKSPILTVDLPPSTSTPAPPKIPTDDDKKVELLILSYQKVKNYSIQVMKCCDRLKTVVQDGRIGLLQEFVSHFRTVRDSLRKFIDTTTSVVTSLDLRRNGVEMLKYEILMTTEFLLGNGTSPNAEEFRKLFFNMNVNIDNVMKKYQPSSKMMVKTVSGYKEESCFDNPYFIAEEVNYDNVHLEHVSDCHHFRKTFVGRDHQTFAGVIEKWGPCLISILRDDNADSPRSPGERESLYRVIVRQRDQPERHEIFYPSQVKKSFLGRKPSIKQILQLLDKDINFSKLKQREATRHLEARLLTLDEFRFRPKYKFGLVLCKPGQTTDNEYLGNISGSLAYEKFLNSIATITPLKGFKGFVGGLDSTFGKTGDLFPYTKWNDYEIMFHSSTLLPFKKEDIQQIERKRHIGNDIINVIYLDGDMQFDPTSIKTQFTHVFVIIKQENVIKPDGSSISGYRVAITSSVDVPKFGPPLPNPPLFTDTVKLQHFLLAKLVNGENAALKAPKFSKPNDKAHHAIFDDIVEEFSGSAQSPTKKDNTPNGEDNITSPLVRLFTQGSFSSKKNSAKRPTASLNDLSIKEAAGSKFTVKSPLAAAGTVVASPSSQGTPQIQPRTETPPSSVVAQLLKPNLLQHQDSNHSSNHDSQPSFQLSDRDRLASTMNDHSPLSSGPSHTDD